MGMFERLSHFGLLGCQENKWTFCVYESYPVQLVLSQFIVTYIYYTLSHIVGYAIDKTLEAYKTTVSYL